MKLTRDEIILLAGILAALVVGATVKHYRDLARLPHPPPPVTLAPAGTPTRAGEASAQPREPDDSPER